MKVENRRIPATLKDVAKKAGVSSSTASRVLSDSDYPVSQRLRHKVIRTAKELNYMPNTLGKMLKNNYSDAIGIIVPTLQNPFYDQVIFGIESAAAKNGREIRLFSSHRSVSQERAHILTLLHSHIMALIILSIDSSPDALNNYISYGGKVALLESNFDLNNAIRAETDCFVAGQLAAQHLIDLGHSRIAFLTAPITKSFRMRILDGIQSVLKRSGSALEPEDIFVADVEKESDIGMYEFETGCQLAKELLQRKKKYTAIVTINDMMAFGVIQVLHQNGVAVPNDISVIGFDNIMYSEMLSPPLTTVHMASSSMGFAACQLLISEIESGKTDIESMVIQYPCSLIVRQSTRNIAVKD